MAKSNNDNRTVYVFFGIAAMALYVLPKLKQGRAVKRVANSYEIEFAKVDISHNNFLLSFKIINPSPNQITVRALAGDVVVNGLKSGIIYSVDHNVIKPESFSTVTATVKMMAVPAVINLLNQLTGKQKGYTIQFIGTVNIDGNMYPVNIGYHL